MCLVQRNWCVKAKHAMSCWGCWVSGTIPEPGLCFQTWWGSVRKMFSLTMAFALEPMVPHFAHFVNHLVVSCHISHWQESSLFCVLSMTKGRVFHAEQDRCEMQIMLMCYTTSVQVKGHHVVQINLEPPYYSTSIALFFPLLRHLSLRHGCNVRQEHFLSLHLSSKTCLLYDEYQ